MDKKTKKKAIELMRTYAQVAENKREFQARIAAEKESYDNRLKELEAQLVEIGVAHRDEFNADGNLDLEHGYLHAAQSTRVVQTGKFDLAAFNEAKPDLVQVTLKVAPIKKMWVDNTARKELKSLGVDLKAEETIEVLLHKK